jgi:hypothetical protein
MHHEPELVGCRLRRRVAELDAQQCRCELTHLGTHDINRCRLRPEVETTGCVGNACRYFHQARVRMRGCEAHRCPANRRAAFVDDDTGNAPCGSSTLTEPLWDAGLRIDGAAFLRHVRRSTVRRCWLVITKLATSEERDEDADCNQRDDDQDATTPPQHASILRHPPRVFCRDPSREAILDVPECNH